MVFNFILSFKMLKVLDLSHVMFISLISFVSKYFMLSYQWVLWLKVNWSNEIWIFYEGGHAHYSKRHDSHDINNEGSIDFSEYEPPSCFAKNKTSFHRIPTQFLSYTQEIYDPHISCPLPPWNNNHNRSTTTQNTT